jgi:hypothetical protein
MAKGQKRSNREPKKPKQIKKPAQTTPDPGLVKGILLVNARNNRK